MRSRTCIDSMGTAQHARAACAKHTGERPTVRGRLDGLPSDTPIMTYCTGGIRCVKVNALLETSGPYPYPYP